jgi:hypothetical protein
MEQQQSVVDYFRYGLSIEKSLETKAELNRREGLYASPSGS